jgi:transposase
VLVGIEATGSMYWFLNLMDDLGIECLVGHPATIRAAEPRKQKHDRRDANLILKLLAENRFPAIWLPTKELLDDSSRIEEMLGGQPRSDEVTRGRASRVNTNRRIDDGKRSVWRMALLRTHMGVLDGKGKDSKRQIKT